MNKCATPRFTTNQGSARSDYTISTDGLTLLFAHGRDFVSARQIMVLSSDRNYTQIFFRNRKNHLSSCTLGYLLSKLPPDMFIRVHHGHAVNRDYVQSVGKNYIQLIDGSRWEISRRKQKQVMESLSAVLS